MPSIPCMDMNNVMQGIEGTMNKNKKNGTTTSLVPHIEAVSSTVSPYTASLSDVSIVPTHQTNKKSYDHGVVPHKKIIRSHQSLKNQQAEALLHQSPLNTYSHLSLVDQHSSVMDAGGPPASLFKRDSFSFSYLQKCLSREGGAEEESADSSSTMIGNDAAKDLFSDNMISNGCNLVSHQKSSSNNTIWCGVDRIWPPPS